MALATKQSFKAIAEYLLSVKRDVPSFTLSAQSIEQRLSIRNGVILSFQKGAEKKFRWPPKTAYHDMVNRSIKLTIAVISLREVEMISDIVRSVFDIWQNAQSPEWFWFNVYSMSDDKRYAVCYRRTESKWRSDIVMKQQSLSFETWVKTWSGIDIDDKWKSWDRHVLGL
jgi:hypothetical protein